MVYCIYKNIVLKKIHITKKDSKTQIFTYTHNSYRNNIGKICAVLKAQIDSNNEELNKFDLLNIGCQKFCSAELFCGRLDILPTNFL